MCRGGTRPSTTFRPLTSCVSKNSWTRYSKCLKITEGAGGGWRTNRWHGTRRWARLYHKNNDKHVYVYLECMTRLIQHQPVLKECSESHDNNNTMTSVGWHSKRVISKTSKGFVRVQDWGRRFSKTCTKQVEFHEEVHERLKTKNEESTHLTDTGLVVELEHLKTKTRLIDEKFPSVRGECETSMW